MFNSATLYFIGGAIERNYGPAVFLRIFSTCASASCLCTYASQPPPPYVKPLYGPGSVVAGMLTFYILKYRNITFMLFFLPINSYAMGGLILFNALVMDRSNMQLGGILGGVISYLTLRGL